MMEFFSLPLSLPSSSSKRVLSSHMTALARTLRSAYLQSKSSRPI